MTRDKNSKLEHFINLVYEEKMFSEKGNLGTPKKFSFYLKHLFAGIDLKGKRILDIGAGNGVLDFYMSIMGAKSVLCLEPELSGSSNDIEKTFCRFTEELEIHNVALERKTFQEIDSDGGSFDILLLHNSINHLDENSCAALHYDLNAKEAYYKLLSKLYELTALNGCVIITDCSRFNFYSTLGLKNPFAPTITWKYHQSPYLWRKLLKKAGYIPVSLRWTSISKLGNIGRLLLDNRVAAYFLMSHFNLIMQKTPE